MEAITSTQNYSSTVMLIDDNQIDLFINKEIIKLVLPYCNIISFKNGIAALNYLKLNFKNKCKKNIPDFILLDLHMPVGDGFDFFREYQLITLKLDNRPSVIVLTCSLDPNDRIKCSKYNFVSSFVSKPLTEIAITNLLVSHKFSTILENSV